MTLSIATFSIMTLSITTFSIMTLSIATFSIMTLNIMGLFVTLSINDTQHINSLYSVSVSVIVMLSVIMLNVVMLSVVAPYNICTICPNF